MSRRWFADTVSYRTQTSTGGTRANPTGGITYGTATTAGAIVRIEQTTDEDSTSSVRSARELRIGIDPDVATQPEAGMELTITACRDATLVGKVGEITLVERDALAVMRRCVVRLGNDA